MPTPLSRRSILGTVAGAAAAAVVAPAQALSGKIQPAGEAGRVVVNNRIKHSACRWCYGSMKLEDLCANAAAMGLSSVELLTEKEWSIPKQYGLTCAVAMGPGVISDGWNEPKNHENLIEGSLRLLPLVKEAGLPNMIVFGGNRRGMPDAEGLKNCAAGLRQITPTAEKLGVTVIMELLNSKVDHGDYMCDRTPWGVELVQAVGSDRFRLLYDIYHMQIMEGDVIRTIRDHHKDIAHYHTGGVPGRHEIDESQELNYAAVCRAIIETGYTGYLGQEFIPTKDPMSSLRQAVKICDV